MYCLVLLHQMHIFGIEITFSEIKNKPAFLKQVYKTINIHNEYKTLNNFLITHNQQVNPINEIVFTHKYQEK